MSTRSAASPLPERQPESPMRRATSTSGWSSRPGTCCAGGSCRSSAARAHHLDIVGINYYWTNQWEWRIEPLADGKIPPLADDDPRRVKLRGPRARRWQRYGGDVMIIAKRPMSATGAGRGCGRSRRRRRSCCGRACRCAASASIPSSACPSGTRRTIWTPMGLWDPVSSRAARKARAAPPHARRIPRCATLDACTPARSSTGSALSAALPPAARASVARAQVSVRRRIPPRGQLLRADARGYSSDELRPGVSSSMVAVGSRQRRVAEQPEGRRHHAAPAVGALDPERHRLVDPADHQAGEDPRLEIEQIAAGDHVSRAARGRSVSSSSGPPGMPAKGPDRRSHAKDDAQSPLHRVPSRARTLHVLPMREERVER